VLRRKNPLDVIAAYTAAFGPDDGAALVLKSINGHHRPEDLARVRRAAGRRADIHVLDGYRTGGQMRGMLELSDCVVSLHRSEGYGLNLADAMARGTPVLATGFSGNMTFMGPDTAFLVPYELVPVGPDAAPYPADALWAQPDLTAAAGLMRTIFDDPEAARARGRAGQEDILKENGVVAAGARVRELALDLTGWGA
jgi:glycosyltransferase involved in cell wall biosynthesis